MVNNTIKPVAKDWRKNNVFITMFVAPEFAEAFRAKLREHPGLTKADLFRSLLAAWVESPLKMKPKEVQEGGPQGLSLYYPKDMDAGVEKAMKRDLYQHKTDVFRDLIKAWVDGKVKVQIERPVYAQNKPMNVMLSRLLHVRFNAMLEDVKLSKAEIVRRLMLQYIRNGVLAKRFTPAEGKRVSFGVMIPVGIFKEFTEAVERRKTTRNLVVEALLDGYVSNRLKV